MMNYDSERKGELKPTSAASNTALAAVALQDHWMRSLAIKDPLLVNRHKVPRHQPKQWRKNVKPVVDTGRGNLKSKKKVEVPEKEYVLDPKPAPLTLAQKMGFVDSPCQPLSENEWKKAKEKSNQRDDSKQPCVICKEEFGVQEQVLLSCTHVFHRACLHAFERFTGRKCCPMCRKEQYQTRVIHEGARQHREQCATRIQAVWRGYVVRCWYKKLRESVPPKDPKLRRKFYQEKLSSITDRMIKSLDFDVGGFLREIDANIQASRDIMRQFEDATKEISNEEWENIQLKAVERGNRDCPICLTLLEEEGLVSKLTGKQPEGHPQMNDPKQHQGKQCLTYPKSKASYNLKSGFHTRATVAGSSSRFNASGIAETGHSNSAKRSSAKNSAKVESTDRDSTKKIETQAKRSTILLSCSHVFHQTCLEAFEDFAVGERRHLCPVCRTQYQKKTL